MKLTSLSLLAFANPRVRLAVLALLVGAISIGCRSSEPSTAELGEEPADELVETAGDQDYSDPANAQEVTELGDDTFMATIGAESRPVLVDFWAPWCGPCRMMGPVIEEMAADGAAGAFYAKVNVDDAEAVASEYNIRSIPAFLIFKDGKEVGRIIGVNPKEKLLTALKAAG